LVKIVDVIPWTRIYSDRYNLTPLDKLIQLRAADPKIAACLFLSQKSFGQHYWHARLLLSVVLSILVKLCTKLAHNHNFSLVFISLSMPGKGVNKPKVTHFVHQTEYDLIDSLYYR